MRERIRHFFRERVREPLLLEQAQRTAQSYSSEQSARLRTLAAAAMRRLDASLEMRDERSTPAALVLQREAAALLITTLLVARGDHDLDSVLRPEEAWRRLMALVDSGAVTRVPVELERAKSVLSDPEPLAADRLPISEAREARLAGEAVLLWLLRGVETRTARGIRFQRVLRVSVLVAAVGVLLTSLIVSAAAPRNIARGKPVLASSHRPATPDPSEIVDGSKDGDFGVHTVVEDAPWVRIDLLAPHKISKVVVYNRSDGWFDEVLPLALELSDDGKMFREVAARDTHFSESDPWTVKLGGESARYVRLHKKNKGALCLKEVEIF